jgi:putative membrane protein
MIVRPRPGAFELLFILRGSIVPVVAPRILLVFVVSAMIALAHHVAPERFYDLGPTPFTLVGLALSIFLGFRNNACYERWWEGRKQWGQLIAEVRSFARDCLTVLPDDPVLHARVIRRVVGFAHVLRDQLRGTSTELARPWLPETEWPTVAQSRNQVDAVLLLQATELRRLLHDGALSDILYRGLSDRLESMTTIQTACERLRATPTPFAYSLLLHRTAWLFCLFLPVGLVSTVGLATPVAIAILAYAFFGLDALGEELEEPFSLSQNALPLDALVRSIEIAALQALGETALPEPLRPERYILR